MTAPEERVAAARANVLYTSGPHAEGTTSKWLVRFNDTLMAVDDIEHPPSLAADLRLAAAVRRLHEHAMDGSIDHIGIDYAIRVYEADDGEAWYVIEREREPIGDGPTLEAAIEEALR